VPKKKTRS